MAFSEEHKEKIRQAHLKHNVVSREAICEMARQGTPTKEIAAHFNRTTHAINKTLRKNGIKPIRGVNPKKGVSSKPEQVTGICEMAKNGKTRKEIAEHFDVGHSRVCSVLKEQGIILEKAQQPKADPEKIKQICDMFKEGKTVTEIAKYFGNTHSRICKVLNSRGLRSRKPNINRPDGKIVMKEGYLGIRIPDDDPLVCMRTNRGEVLEHRYVMAKSIGRPLTKDETVHHKNGNREDNRLENLQLMKSRHGKGQAHQCVDCGSYDIDIKDYYICNQCQSTKIKPAEI